MNCKEIRECCGFYHDEVLNTDQCADIETHLRQCQKCQQFYKEQKQLDAALRKNLKQPFLPTEWWQTEKLAIQAAFNKAGKSTAKPKVHFCILVKQYLSVWHTLLWPRPSYYLFLAILWMILLIVNSKAGFPVIKNNSASVLTPERKAALAAQYRELKALLSATEWEFPQTHNKPPPPRTDWHDDDKHSA